MTGRHPPPTPKKESRVTNWSLENQANKLKENFIFYFITFSKRLLVDRYFFSHGGGDKVDDKDYDDVSV